MSSDFRHWSFEWLDEYDVRSMEDARTRLDDSRAVIRLRELAESTDSNPTNLAASPDALVAGSGIDLTGYLHCSHPECLKGQIDELFSKVWHYFDEVIVGDALTHEIVHHWHETENSRRLADLVEWLSVPIHLQAMGAESLVQYQTKWPIRGETWQERATAVGLEPVIATVDDLIDRVAEESQSVRKDDLWYFNHPDFEHTQNIPVSEVEVSGLSHKARHREVTSLVVHRFLDYLSIEWAAARSVAAPLGTVTWIHRELLNAASISHLTPGAVAFELELPFLPQIGATELLRLREDERSYFDDFRASLRVTLDERLRGAGDANAERIALELDRELESKVLAIRRRLAEADRSRIYRRATGIGVGALVTVCGAISSVIPEAAGLAIPLATLGAGIQATEGLINPETAYRREVSEVSQASEFFLWKVATHKAAD